MVKMCHRPKSQRILSQTAKLSRKNENLSNPETLKTNFKNISKNVALSKIEAVSKLKTNLLSNLHKVSTRATIGHNVGSYTQGRIAGDFLSSRKAARAERCPPKTTAAALDG